ncbi:DUF2142 domain-containing protein [Candidatus Saccharibacteria bacterium]|nr:DUF2142 domain-containing protein [Candidatus Saccharibacteria bacterium]
MKNFGTRIITFIKNYKKEALLTSFFTLLNLVFLGLSFAKTKCNSFWVLIVLAILSIALEIVSCFFIFRFKKNNWKIEKLFLILGLLIGIFYVFVIPVGRAPDEESHFFRVYELSRGNFVTATHTEDGYTGSVGPSNVDKTVRSISKQNATYKDMLHYSTIQADPSDEKIIITSAYGYNILNYLPQTIGMTIGNTFNLPFIMSGYIAKLFNLVTCIIILFYCIKYIPILKKFIFFIAFLPSTMQAMASLSVDGLIFAAAIALISFVLYARYSLKKPLTNKQLLLSLIICIFLSAGKIVYGLLCLLLFAIPKERFVNNKRKIITIFLIGSITLAVTLIWFLIKPSSVPATDSAAQISTIINTPLRFSGIMLNSLSTFATLYIGGALGQYLEWFNVVLSPIYVVLCYTVMVILINDARQTFRINRVFKNILIWSSLVIFLSTFVFMFITWTKTGESLIDGIQGRYFLPILPAIPVAFITVQKDKKSHLIKPESLRNTFFYIIIISVSVYALLTIACSHI